MYIELVLDDINDLVDKAPQYRMIPALIFSSSGSSRNMQLASKLLHSWFFKFHLKLFCLSPFKSLELSKFNHKIHPQGFAALSRLPQRQLSWSADMAVTMKIILNHLVHLSSPGPDKRLYRSPHQDWLRRHKSWKQTSLGSPRLTSTSSHGFRIIIRGYHEENAMSVLGIHGDKHTALSRWRMFRTRDWDLKEQRRGCRVLLEAVIFYLHKSDCTKDVVALARRSLPEIALWSPRLMKRARREMDTYVCRWEGMFPFLCSSSTLS